MKIAEVSKKYDISADTLRYYERIGLMNQVRRSESGIREYSEQDCARIQFIKCMRGAHVPIEALIEYMNLLEAGDATIPARIALLEEQRELVQERLAEIQAGLDRLNYKIEHYHDIVLQSERTMYDA